MHQAPSRLGLGLRSDAQPCALKELGTGQRSAGAGHLHRPNEFLTLIESHALTGAWSWHFLTNEHVWSPGCFHVLGLDPRSVRPGYDVLLGLVHPDDRLSVARATDVRRGDVLSAQTFRIVRPDGTVRILRSRNDIKFGLDGRPRSALGTLVDVTDRERNLRAQASYRNAIQALDRTIGTLRFSMTTHRGFDFEPAAADALGQPLATINTAPFAMLDVDERDLLNALIDDHNASGIPLLRTIVLRPPDRRPIACRLVMVPMRGEQGEVQGWQGLLQLMDPAEADPRNAVDPDVDAILLGCHVRAARALLDWSMSDLAAASGLSLSTVRRFEADDPSRCLRSRSGIVSTLCRAGIEFRKLGDGRLGISRIG